jgi:hypothetical protein
MTHRYTDPAAARAFALGGNATFTIVSVQTGTRFTYKVRASEDSSSTGAAPARAGVFFVSLLTGDNNETNYSYLGIIPKDDPMTFRLTAKSRAGAEAASVKAFTWFWRQLSSGRLPANVECWHEGSCGRCGRKLTVPSSIESGFGPECIQHV